MIESVVPFSSATKISAAVVSKEGSTTVLVKGAPEYVLARYRTAQWQRNRKDFVSIFFLISFLDYFFSFVFFF